MKNMVLVALWSALLGLGCGLESGGDGAAGPGSDLPTGKTDSAGSCDDGAGGSYCGSRSPDGCWCDAACTSYGNCCGDYAPVCEGGGDGGVPLAYRSYDVRFTNPVCGTYLYDQPVPTADGSDELLQKPQNVFCDKNRDFGPASARPESPQYKLLEWTRSLSAGDELFLAYLSFSNYAVGDALCEAAERGVDVTFVLDSASSLSTKIEGCGGHVILRGHKGGIGYAHNKLFIVNPNGAGPGDDNPDYMRMAFGSGNMSSGTVLHHENWHFIEVARDTYFAEAHRCVIAAQLSDEAAASTTNYGAFLNDCRDEIAYPEETDIRAFFIPSGDDATAINALMLDAVRDADTVDIGAHRFGHPRLVWALRSRLQYDANFQARMVADDDLYWLRPLTGSSLQLGDNQQFEASNVATLAEAGDFEIRYLETNSEQHLLHHNKFLIFHGLSGRPDAVLCGAANLTDTGFNTNFENIYYVEIPAVVTAFDQQFNRFWNGEKASPSEPHPPVATPAGRMPAYPAATHAQTVTHGGSIPE